MKMLGLILMMVMGASAVAQGVSGSGGTGMDLVGMPEDPQVQLAALKRGRSSNAFVRYPYYLSAVSCASLQQSIESFNGLVIYESRGRFNVYATWDPFCPVNEHVYSVIVEAGDGPCRLNRCKTRPAE